MCGALSGLREVVDQALRILGLEGDDAGELALVVRVVVIVLVRPGLSRIAGFNANYQH